MLSIRSHARRLRRNLERAVRRGLGLACLLTVANCNSSSGSDGEPLISGAVTLGYADQPYTMMYGIAVDHDGAPLVGFGTDPIDCDSVNSQNPPTGTSAVVTLSSLAPGTYSNVSVELIHNTSDLEISGASTGAVTITDMSADSVAGTVTFSNTGSDNKTYDLDGMFDVHHCP
jgi:hypothetical protein